MASAATNVVELPAPLPVEVTRTREFPCDVPGCGKVLASAQGLGAHRRQAHGIAGTPRNRGKKGVAAKKTAKTVRVSAARVSVAAVSNGGPPKVDRDALLVLVFPNGIPPRQSALDGALGWLETADTLAAGAFLDRSEKGA